MTKQPIRTIIDADESGSIINLEFDGFRVYGNRKSGWGLDVNGQYYTHFARQSDAIERGTKEVRS